MSDPVAPEPPEPPAQPANPASAAEPARKRRGPPTWGVAAFLVLLAGMLFVNQFASTSGPAIHWIDNDFAAALAQASKDKSDIFLYLYDKADPDAGRNDREVFSQRCAREPLAGVICCRVSVTTSSQLAARYAYKNTPLFLVLDHTGAPVSRTQGAVGELQYRTNISEPLQRSHVKPTGGQQP